MTATPTLAQFTHILEDFDKRSESNPQTIAKIKSLIVGNPDLLSKADKQLLISVKNKLLNLKINRDDPSIRKLNDVLNALGKQILRQIFGYASKDEIAEEDLASEKGKKLLENPRFCADLLARKDVYFDREKTFKLIFKAGPFLQFLDLRGLDVTDKELSSIAKICPNIKELNLYGNDTLTDAGIGHLVGFKSLESLDLGSCDSISDNSLTTVSKLTTLKSLSLDSCYRLTGSAIANLAVLTNLTKLNLFGCDKVKDNTIKKLCGLNKLEVLNLGRCTQISNDAMNIVCCLSKLKELNLSSCKEMDDIALGYISKLSHMEFLTLNNNPNFTNAGLAQIAPLTNMTKLDVSRCPKISDEGLLKLKGMNKLKYLVLYECNVQKPEAIKAAFPSAHVI